MEALVERGRVDPHHDNHDAHEHKKNIKKGSERLDRRSAAGVHGQPKKSGRGGKFTWGGPTSEEYNQDESVVAFDEKDPNYDDEEQEGKIKKAVTAELVEPSKSPSASQSKDE